MWMLSQDMSKKYTKATRNSREKKIATLQTKITYFMHIVETSFFDLEILPAYNLVFKAQGTDTFSFFSQHLQDLPDNWIT